MRYANTNISTIHCVFRNEPLSKLFSIKTGMGNTYVYLYLKKRKQTYFNSLIKEGLLANLLNVLIFENDQKCLRKSFYIYAPDPIMQKGLVSPIMLSSRHYAAPK